MTTVPPKIPRARGFAALPLERHREIASAGGKAVRPENRSFSKNRELAVEAGRKGGQATPAGSRSFSHDPELAAIAGKKGGEARRKPQGEKK